MKHCVFVKRFEILVCVWCSNFQFCYMVFAFLAVCSIAATSDSLMVSGSWDLTAKVWLDMQNIATLSGHSVSQ